jgi:hypothetical protein
MQTVLFAVGKIHVFCYSTDLWIQEGDTLLKSGCYIITKSSRSGAGQKFLENRLKFGAEFVIILTIIVKYLT